MGDDRVSTWPVHLLSSLLGNVRFWESSTRAFPFKGPGKRRGKGCGNGIDREKGANDRNGGLSSGTRRRVVGLVSRCSCAGIREAQPGCYAGRPLAGRRGVSCGQAECPLRLPSFPLQSTLPGQRIVSDVDRHSCRRRETTVIRRPRGAGSSACA
jgi:hypothetical protein